MRKYIPLIIFLAFILGLNIYFRSFTINFLQLKAKVKEAMEEGVRRAATQEVFRKFPQFNPLAKERLIKNKILEYKKQNWKTLQSQIQNSYYRLKDRYQDESGQTYLMELDGWHWGRYVDNIVRLGHPGDEIIYGKQKDNFMLAPLGFYMVWDQFLFYLSAFLYKFFSLFKKIPLFTFLFYLPLFFISLFMIALYIFSLRYAGHLGATLSCLFVGLAPICISRSCAGWFDKDTLNLLFPLLVVWTYLLAKDASNFRRRLFWLCLSSFLVGLFCFNWTHWWFIFFIAVMYEILSLGVLIFIYLRSKEKNLALIKQHFLSLISFLIFCFSWILLLVGPTPLFDLYKQIRQAIVLNKPLVATIWPNVYYTVGELRKLTFTELTHSVGNRFLLVSSLSCLLVLIARAFLKREYNTDRFRTVMLLSLWFISMLFASLRGIRFVIFLLIPLGLSLGWLFNDIYLDFKKKYKVFSWGFFVIAFIVFAAVCANRAENTAKGIFPLMNDNWYKVLSLVKEKSSPETILNSWWDFGDWFKTVANRRVIFDGQSQHTPQAYWMGKALISNNENEAIAILRMLNNGGNRAFEIINEHLKDPLRSVLLLESILLYNPQKARQTLLEFLPPSAVNQVIKILYSMPGKACFVVDDSMVFKMPAISYLGSWYFPKVYIAQNFRNQEKDVIIEHLKRLGRDPSESQRLYQEAFLIPPADLDDWFSNKVQFYGGLLNGREKDGNVFFDNGFIYNPKEQIAYSNSGIIPRSLFVLAEDKLVEYVYPNANTITSIMIIKVKEEYKAILLDRELANSLFSRLYFFGGKGLRHFAPFIDAEEGNNYLRVFKIVW